MDGRFRGLHVHLRPLLASAHAAVAHAGRRPVREGPRRVPRHQPGAAPWQHPPPVPGARPDDRRRGTVGLRHRTVRAAPAARRVGRLDRRAEGRAQHGLLDADDVGMGGVCADRAAERLLDCAGVVCAGPDGQADARHAPGDAAAARRVAVRAAECRRRCRGTRVARRGPSVAAARSREGPVLPPGGRVRRGGRVRAGDGGREPGIDPRRRTRGQRLGRHRQLPREDGVAGRPDGVLPDAGRAQGLDRPRVASRAGRRYRGCVAGSEARRRIWPWDGPGTWSRCCP